MQRKKFLQTAMATALGASFLPKAALAAVQNEGAAVIPAYLKQGDAIGITASAGYITMQDCEKAIGMMQSWGFQIKIGDTIGKKYYTLGGTDEERIKDLQQMLDDVSMKAIMIARGGYGLVRIIDKLDFTKFKKNPKWIIGFSDVTVLHSHIHACTGVASIHSKMCNSFVDVATAEQSQIISLQSIEQCLSGKPIEYTFEPNSQNKLGVAKGILIGGNAKTLESIAGSDSDIDTRNKILFVEDTGEYLYSIDRIFFNLKRSGKLNKLAGLIVGGFKVKNDTDTEPFGKTVEEIVLEKVKEFNYPVCFNFPVGHQKYNVALKCGVQHQLTINNLNNTLKALQ
jgi:muramoyltetrapeptide carboxypeptidase